MIAKLAHYSVRTAHLEASRRFYTEVLQLRVGFRPPFRFPGLWLYFGDDETDYGVVHLIGVDPNGPGALHDYFGERPGSDRTGTGSVDHIAFLATDWPRMRARCDKNGVGYVQNTVPALGLHQVFIVDPSGVTIELNYPLAEANAPRAQLEEV